MLCVVWEHFIGLVVRIICVENNTTHIIISRCAMRRIVYDQLVRRSAIIITLTARDLCARAWAKMTMREIHMGNPDIISMRKERRHTNPPAIPLKCTERANTPHTVIHPRSVCAISNIYVRAILFRTTTLLRACLGKQAQ